MRSNSIATTPAVSQQQRRTNSSITNYNAITVAALQATTLPSL